MGERIAGDVDYGAQGGDYSVERRTDPRIAAMIHRHLGDARTVLNVGAGAGSYEPLDRHVIPIEPSSAMRAQRPRHLAPAINAVAENLPLDDKSVDAAMSTVSVHQWRDLKKGVGEMRRVARGPIVILTFDGAALERFWLHDYVPELTAAERKRDPNIPVICECLGGTSTVLDVPIPIDCVDGFSEAFYARPERFLDERVRRSQSAWNFVPPQIQTRFVATLAADLESGAWDKRYGAWRTQPTYQGALRLIVAQP